MLTEPTLEKLKTLKLYAMANLWLEQQKTPDPHPLSFEERLGLLVDAECLSRENKRLTRRLREAKLKISQACLENLDYSAKRELDKAVIRQLSTGRWIFEKQNVIITGATGVGKTFVACALAQQACRQDYRVLYRRASRLSDELSLAKADGSYTSLLTKLAHTHLLVIDDFGLTPLTEPERRHLLEIVEDRYSQSSTVITSQLPTPQWHAFLGDPTLADAICDRLLHNAHRVVLKGPSRRKEESLENNHQTHPSLRSDHDALI